MPTSVVSLKLKRFRYRFGISAPRVVVRSHVPWQWLVPPFVLLALLLAVGGWLVAQKKEAGVLGAEVESLRQQLKAQSDELSVLRTMAGTGQSAVSIERAAQQQLLGKIQGLEAENAVLREDILLFERLIPIAGEGTSIRIENFMVLKEAETRFRYRLLLAFHSDKQTPDFRGRLQLAIKYANGGKVLQLLLPEGRDNAAEFQLEIKHFLRREGGFELPAGAVLQGVEARVLQGDTLRAKRLAQF